MSRIEQERDSNKATLYGICVHDYTMTPCQKERDCMTCKERVCIKGEHLTLQRITQLEKMTTTLLEKTHWAARESVFGADRWGDHQTWKLSLVRSIRTMLESNSVPDGAVLHIPEEYDPSPVRRALMDRNFVKMAPSAEMLPIEVIPLLEVVKDA